jgi:hypothetical protein
MPARLTPAQIEDLLARDEAQLAAYLGAAAEAEAEGRDPGHARGLARFVEERVALLRPVREARLAAERAERGRRPSGSLRIGRRWRAAAALAVGLRCLPEAGWRGPA